MGRAGSRDVVPQVFYEQALGGGAVLQPRKHDLGGQLEEGTLVPPQLCGRGVEGVW